MKLYGKEFTKDELFARIGDLSAVGGVRKNVLEDGKGRGMRAYDVRTGTGFAFTVVPDRGLDIMHCEYNGVPLAFVSKNGLVAPGLHIYEGMSFLRSFTAGLLTTCGLKQSGAFNTDNGQVLPLHGRYNAIPAEEVTAETVWNGDEAEVVIRGTVRETQVFSEHLALHREIRAKLGESRVIITDTLENAGFSDEEFMLLYHCNFGYPIVSENTVLTVSKLTQPVRARDAVAETGLGQENVFSAPIHEYQEQCFYYKPEGPQAGACLYNTETKMGAYVRYGTQNLPYLIEWKQMGQGDYVVGLEPSTNTPEGRSAARKCGELKVIPARSALHFQLEIGFTEKQLFTE